MLWYEDKQRIVCKINKVLYDNCIGLKINDIQFIKDIESQRLLYNIDNFFCQRILKNNTIIFTIEKLIDNFNGNERLLYIKKMVDEINLNCPLRRFSEKVIFRLENFNNQHMLLYVISYMNHEYISSIEIPISVLMVNSNKYNKLREDIFNGFPKFHNLVLSFNEFTTRCSYNLPDYEETIEKIFNELSKRQNSSLTLLEEESCTNENFLNFCFMIIRIGVKYEIKIKCNSSICMLLTKKANILSLFGKILPYPKKEIILSKDIMISNSKYFYTIIKKLQTYKCLKCLKLGFEIFDITKNHGDIDNLNQTILSLKNNRKLKKVTLNFLKYHYSNNELVNEMYLKNLKYLISLMPSTIERLEIIYGWNMRKDMANLINKYMPNIKILKIINIPEPLDCDFIMEFKNLEAFITCQKQKINIPQNVKFLCIGCLKGGEYNDKEFSDKLLLEHYSIKFSKLIYYNPGKFIFFKDISHWNNYKKYIQEAFF